MFQYSKKVKSCLLHSGWFEGRRIDLDEFKMAAKSEGYPWLPSVEFFLQEFGNLEIVFYRPEGTDSLHFNLQKAAYDIDSKWVKEEYSQRLNKIELCVIGQSFSNHMTLLMDRNGKVYGGYDDELFLFGNSGEEAIEAICSSGKPIKIT